MANELITRSISGIIIVLIVISSIILGGIYTNIMLLSLATLMIFEWCKINKNKSTWIYNLGLIYILLPILYWFGKLHTSPQFKSHLLLIFIMVWVADVFAYIGGRIFKGPKLAPSISPKKTWSGAVSGFAASMIVSFMYINLAQGFVIPRNMFLSAVVSIGTILGDLLESKAKRLLSVKDSGNIIPGHGGFCDRFDSFLMATYTYAIFQFCIKLTE